MQNRLRTKRRVIRFTRPMGLQPRSPPPAAPRTYAQVAATLAASDNEAETSPRVEVAANEHNGSTDANAASTGDAAGHEPQPAPSASLPEGSTFDRGKMIADFEAMIGDVPWEFEGLPAHRRAESWAQSCRIEQMILDGTLMLRQLPLFGPITKTYLNNCVRDARDRGDVAAAVAAEFAWWRNNGFNHKCARDCGLALVPSSAGVPCHTCVEVNAGCYLGSCDREFDRRVPGCPLLHYTDTILVATAFCGLGIWQEEAFELSRIFFDGHEWSFDPSWYYYEDPADRQRKLPARGSALTARPYAETQPYKHMILRAFRHLVTWPEALQDLSAYKRKYCKRPWAARSFELLRNVMDRSRLSTFGLLVLRANRRPPSIPPWTSDGEEAGDGKHRERAIITGKSIAPAMISPR